MNNLNQSEKMTLDQINEFKQKCQDSMALVELLKNKLPLNTLLGLERDQKLACMGFTQEQIEEMTGFKSGEYRFCDGGQSSEEVRLRFYGKEILDKLNALEKQSELECEAQYERHLNYGMAQGFVEEICIDSKL
jgi:hypothetical protein